MAFSPYLGPSFQDNQVYKCLVRNKIPFTESNEEKIFDLIAKELHGGKIIGWFQGQMEWGPRALGNRSILADATKISMQKNLNLKIKKREGFRPFAPVVLEEFAAKYFDLSSPSPLMQYTTTVLNSKITSTNSLKFYERLTQIDSPIPAVTHLDLSARVQTVNKSDNLALHKLITSYYALSKVPVLINTSFNVRGEPIVCTPQDALDCFLSTDIDILVINNFIIEKSSIAQNRLGIERTFSPD